MARDDYYVVVYQILAYLYDKLKKGEDVDPKQISHNEGNLIHINKRYWTYIMVNLEKYNLIEGLHIITPDGCEPIICKLEQCQITPLGIEFLTENSTINKAKEFFKDVKEIIPFI